MEEMKAVKVWEVVDARCGREREEEEVPARVARKMRGPNGVDVAVLHQQDVLHARALG